MGSIPIGLTKDCEEVRPIWVSALGIAIRVSQRTQIATGYPDIGIGVQLAGADPRFSDALEGGTVEMKMGDAILGLGPCPDKGLQHASR